MNSEELRGILDRLDGESADALESETLEFKSWRESVSLKHRRRLVIEEIVALANQAGGTLILGVDDKERTRADAIHGVGSLDANRLQREIYDGTDPHITVSVTELNESEGRVLALAVHDRMPPYTTTDGMAKIRVGTASQPLTGRALADLAAQRAFRDHTAEIAPEIEIGDLDEAQIRLLRETIVANGASRALANLEDEPLLAELGLASRRGIALAGVLLLGSRAALAAAVPYHEVIIVRRTGDAAPHDLRIDLKQPLLALLAEAERVLEANKRVAVLQTEGFQHLEVPDFSWLAAREALLNALVHRDYRLPQSIHVELAPGRVEITSPGGFMGDITPANILRQSSVRRNPLLAEALQRIGHVERAGSGVAKIYDELLRFGKDPPRYDGGESQVRLTVPTATRGEFALFIHAEQRKGAAFSVDDLILLHGASRRGALNRWSAAELLQLEPDAAAARLASLRERGYLDSQGRGSGTHYEFTGEFGYLADGADPGEPAPRAQQEATMHVLAALRERGRLANADIREITGLSAVGARRLIKGLREQGLVELRGRGRGAHYLPARSVSVGNGSTASG